MKYSIFDWIVTVLVIVGAINWGLVGLLDWNLVAKIFGDGAATKAVYDLVGLAGLYMIYTVSKK